MLFESTEVGKLSISVNAEFKIDGVTAHTCMHLMSLYARQLGCEAIIIHSPDERLEDSVQFQLIENREQFEEDIYNFVKEKKENQYDVYHKEKT